MFTLFSFKYAINVPSDKYSSRIKQYCITSWSKKKKKSNIADAVDVPTYLLGICLPRHCQPYGSHQRAFTGSESGLAASERTVKCQGVNTLWMQPSDNECEWEDKFSNTFTPQVEQVLIFFFFLVLSPRAPQGIKSQLSRVVTS